MNGSFMFTKLVHGYKHIFNYIITKIKPPNQLHHLFCLQLLKTDNGSYYSTLIAPFCIHNQLKASQSN